MKTFSALLCAGLVLTAGAFSAATAGGMKHGHGMKQGQGPGHQALNLSDEQKAQVETLRTEFQQQQEIRAQIEAGTLSREDGLAQMKTAAEAHRTAFESLLTDEQRQQLAEWKQNHPGGPGMGKGGPGMMGSGMHRGRGMGRAGGPGKMVETLGLSEEQKTQWQELAKQQRAKMEELRQSGQRPDPETMRQLFAEHQKAVEAILTPEQLQKWEDMKKNWKGHQPPQPAPTDNTTSGSVSKPAAPGEQTWGQIKSQGK